MKRNPRKVKWTKAFRVLHGKEVSADTSFEFERRRNRPIKYNRQVAVATLRAMKSLERIRVRRGERFYENRMKDVEDSRRRDDRKTLEQQFHLVQMPSALVVRAQIQKDEVQRLKVERRLKVSGSEKLDQYD